MVPSRFSTHVCSEVINCPPKRKRCITLATVFPSRGCYAERDCRAKTFRPETEPVLDF